MPVKYDLRQLLRDRDQEIKLRKKTERHLTQEDIRDLMENQRGDNEQEMDTANGSGDE